MSPEEHTKQAAAIREDLHTAITRRLELTWSASVIAFPDDLKALIDTHMQRLEDLFGETEAITDEGNNDGEKSLGWNDWHTTPHKNTRKSDSKIEEILGNFRDSIMDKLPGGTSRQDEKTKI